MALYAIRNRSTNPFEDDFLGLVVPAKVGANEGVLIVDTNDATSILRAGSDLYTYFTAGTVVNKGNAFTYTGTTPDLYVSAVTTDGENVADVVAGNLALTTDALRSEYAYKVLIDNLASNVAFDGTGTNFLAGVDDLQSAVTSLDIQVATLSGVSDTITWRPNVFALTGDARLNAAGPIAFGTGATLDLDATPFSDDELPTNVSNADLTEGRYLLYKGATAADDRLFKVVGTNLVLQTGADGVQNDGYAYIVKNDLIDTPAAAENQSLWVFVAGTGLTKLSDIDWGEISLQEAYNGGNTIVLANATPFTLSDGTNPIFRASTDTAGNNWVSIDGLGTGQVNITGQAAVNITGQSVTFDDANLTTPVNLSETGIDGFDATEWDQQNNGGTTGNGVFDWSRISSGVDVPTSIIGAIEATREDLNEYVVRVNTPPVLDTDADGANLIGVRGIPGVTPTGGTIGADGSLQAVLEGISSLATSSGGKTYADINAFTTAKAVVGAAPFVLGETVYIQDTNRFVEVLTVDDNIVQGTDWAYVGDLANSISGTDYVVSATNIVLGNGTDGTVKIADGAYLVLPTSTTPGTFTPVAGATAYDSTTGQIYVYDASRSKWVSSFRHLVQFGANSADGQYLEINGVKSGLTGFLLPFNAVITGITIKAGGGLLTKGFEIRRNNSATALASVALVGGIYTANNLNIDIVSTDFLQLFASSAGQKVDNVVATIELAYRK